MVVCKWEKVKKDLAQLLATSPPISPTPYCVIVESDFTDIIFDSVLLLFNGKKEKKKSLYRSNKSVDLPTPSCAMFESDLMVNTFDSVWLLFNGKKEKKKSLYSDNKPTDLPTPYCAILESDLMVQSV